MMEINWREINWRKITLLVITSLVIFLIYFFHAHHFLGTIVYTTGVYGSDTPEITKLMLGERGASGYLDERKHPLFFVATRPVVKVFQHLLGLESLTAVLSTVALIATMNILLFYLLMNKIAQKGSIAILLTFCYAFAYSNLIFFAVPETYSLAILFITLYLFYLVKIDRPRSLRDVVILSFIIGLAVLTNPPLLVLSLSLFYVCYKSFERKAFITMSLISGSVIFLVFTLTSFAFYGAWFYLPYLYEVHEYASFGNVFSGADILQVLVSFFLFSLITPGSGLNTSPLGISTMVGYVTSPLSFLLVVLLVTIISLTFYQIIKKRSYHSSVALIILLSLAFIYLYFNPGESFLYSSQILPLIFFMVSPLTHHLKQKMVIGIIVLALVLLMVNNVLPLYPLM